MKKFFIIYAVIFTVLSMSACDLMFGMFQPDYAGSWSVTESDFFDMKTTYEFSRNEYQITVWLVGEGDVLVDYTILKGIASGTDTSITITPVKYKEIAMTDWGTKTFNDVEWAELTGDDAAAGTISWSVKDDTLALTFPAETEGGEPTTVVFARDEE